MPETTGNEKVKEPGSDAPIPGTTYTPEPSVLPISDGLPRTVTKVRFSEDRSRWVAYYTTTTGKGFESDNLWLEWMADTGATPSATAEQT